MQAAMCFALLYSWPSAYLRKLVQRVPMTRHGDELLQILAPAFAIIGKRLMDFGCWFRSDLDVCDYDRGISFLYLPYLPSLLTSVRPQAATATCDPYRGPFTMLDLC